LARFRDEDIQAVRERTDLVKVVGQYLTLKKAGHDSMVGLCPFHPEKTPSFSVSPSKQVYYCFGCGEGGDAVKFLTRVESLTFPEAIERLAHDAGIQLRLEAESQADRRAASRRQSLHRANAEAAGLYHRLLMDGKEGAEARQYLSSRGIDRAAAEEFEIGYSPMYSDFLLRRLSPNFSPDLLVEAGLASKDGSGTVRDRFRGRITFPIHDLAGQAVAFGGRLLAGEGAKYVNSAESPVYRKGRVLYNLHRARVGVTRSGRAFVVEGYTDVIALARGGLPTAVATCGTALGEDHYALLSRFAQEVVLTFDADEAGARAAERAYAFHEKYPVRTRVLVLPEGLDPADFVKQRGAEEFHALAERAVPLVEYMIGRAVTGHDLSGVEGRAGAVRAGLPIVAGLTDEVRRQEYAALLADRAGVAASSVLVELERIGITAPAEPESRRRPGRASGPDGGNAGRTTAPGGDGGVLSAGPGRTPQQRVEWDMLKLLARSEEAFVGTADRLTDEHFERAGHRRLLHLLRDARGDVRALVSNEDEDPKLAGLLAALATEPLDVPSTADSARKVWARLEDFRLKRRIEEVRRRLQKLNPIREAEDYDRLFGELADLTGAWRRVRELV